MTCFSLCLILYAVVCVTLKRRPSSMLETPCSVWVRRLACNHFKASNAAFNRKLVKTVALLA